MRYWIFQIPSLFRLPAQLSLYRHRMLLKCRKILFPGLKSRGASADGTQTDNGIGPYAIHLLPLVGAMEIKRVPLPPYQRQRESVWRSVRSYHRHRYKGSTVKHIKRPVLIFLPCCFSHLLHIANLRKNKGITILLFLKHQEASSHIG